MARSNNACKSPAIRPCNLALKLRRIWCELSIAMERTADSATAGEIALLMRQTEVAIERINGR
jgi:hypothetical protein